MSSNIPQDDPQWSKVYQSVNENPDNLEEWESLITLTETFLVNNPNGASKETTRSIYDRMLTRFPLLFGYWIKYADLELRLYGSQGCEAIFEKAVAAFPNSVDIWTKYAEFLLSPIEEKPTDDSKREAAVQMKEKARLIFKRGILLVGRDFLSHPLWDSYINFEKLIDPNSNELLNILATVINYPLHQYARYYENFMQLAKIHDVDVKNDVFLRTQQGTLDRWKFESKITRPYFHVVPLSAEELKNWNEYLDFEEQMGDVEQIKSLYGRALVSAALYEEIWLRYVRWSSINSGLDETKNIFKRAIFFVPKKSFKLRVHFTLILESNELIDEARQKLNELENMVTMSSDLSRLADIIMFRVNFEKRISVKNCIAYIDKELKEKSSNLGQTKKEKSSVVTAKENNCLGNIYGPFLTFLKANILWKEKNDFSGARTLYESGFEMYMYSGPFIINYFNFELDQADNDKLHSLWTSINLHAGIPPSIITDINRSYMEFLSRQGTPDAMNLYMQVDMETNGPFMVRHLFKQKIAQTDKEAQTDARLKRENGHPGIDIDISEVVQNKNPLEKYQREQASYGV